MSFLGLVSSIEILSQVYRFSPTGIEKHNDMLAGNAQSVVSVSLRKELAKFVSVVLKLFIG
jgi:hypothetical protein